MLRKSILFFLKFCYNEYIGGFIYGKKKGRGKGRTNIIKLQIDADLLEENLVGILY